jgi:WS/DGAT/MGAT family acyltransferase
MEQLPGSDAIFLAMDTDTVYAHVGALTVLDPSDAPRFSFARVRELTNERIREIPRFTQKLRPVPFELDRPYLVEDPHFNIDNHLHRIAVPSPGTMRELGELAGHLYAQHLDRRKPLWEAWFIEGVEGGKVALLVKTHHCLIDGASGAGLGEMLFDLQPDPPPRQPEPRATPKAPAREQSDWELAARGLASAMLTPSRMARYGFQMARQIGTMLPYLRAPELRPFTGVPQVSFNAPIGPRRALACSSVPLGDVRELKKHFDVKLNDVVLELTASAVRRYLSARGELPVESLAVAIAVSTRAEGDASLGNQVTTIFVSWATDLEDPAERLRKIHENVSKAKEMEKALRAHEIQAIGDTAPPRWINLAWRALLASGVPAPSNLMVSNVPGPPFPLYTAGARIECMYPMSILAPGNGINVTVISYRGRIDFGFTVDPELVPDPWFLAEGIPIALEELKRKSGMA